MSKTINVKINFDISLKDIIESAKYALLAIFIPYTIIMIGLRIVPEISYMEIALYSFVIISGILTALGLWKKIKEIRLSHYAVVCILEYAIFWIAFFLYQYPSYRLDTNWKKTLYYIFFIPVMHLMRFSVISHLITVFILKRVKKSGGS